MGFDRIRIKSNARLFYKNNTGTSICALLIYLGISLGATIALYMIGMVFGIFSALTTTSTGATGSLGERASTAFMMFTYAFSFVISIGLMPLAMGLMDWFRRTIYEKISLSEMFCLYRDGRFWGAVGTTLLMSLFIYLWSLLFVIPGLIKVYSYSQAMFIKAENPNIPASRAIELSKIMMEGHKWDLFILHCSFIGWGILSALTYNILGIVYVFPYFYASLAFAYEEIKADAASRNLIDIREINPDFVQYDNMV
ncbi:MAG: DUF975 family protein [Oscillospiraceae bacterium]|nr:DUF975 family protein [Oscillospiraceae bacterium]